MKITHATSLVAHYQNKNPGPKVARNSEAPIVTFIDKKGLAALGIIYSSVHLLRLEAEKKFPKRVYLSPNRVVWVKSEIDEYISRVVTARN